MYHANFVELLIKNYDNIRIFLVINPMGICQLFILELTVLSAAISIMHLLIGGDEADLDCGQQPYTGRDHTNGVKSSPNYHKLPKTFFFLLRA